MLESDAKSAHNEQIIDNNEQLNGPSEQITDNNEQLNGPSEQITERQRTVRFVERNPSTTYEDMARAAGVSSATVRRDAEILIGRGLLKRVGSRKSRTLGEVEGREES